MSAIQNVSRFSVSLQDSVYVTFQQPIARRKSTPASPGSPASDREMKVRSGYRSLNRKPPQALSPPSRGPFSGTPRPAVRPPTRCLSPILAYSQTQNKCGPERTRTVPGAVCANSSGSFSQGLRQEVKRNDPQHKVRHSPWISYHGSWIFIFSQRLLNIAHFVHFLRTNERLSTPQFKGAKSLQNVIFESN